MSDSFHAHAWLKHNRESLTTHVIPHVFTNAPQSINGRSADDRVLSEHTANRDKGGFTLQLVVVHIFLEHLRDTVHSRHPKQVPTTTGNGRHQRDVKLDTIPTCSFLE